MPDIKQRKPAQVDRRLVSSRKIEALVAGLVVFGMLALFILVRPDNMGSDPLVDAGVETIDFRDELPDGQTVERFGQVTSGASAADVLEVLGASPEDAERAVKALRETGIVDRKRMRPGIALTAHFDESILTDGLPQLIAVSMKPDAKRMILATRRTDGSFFGSVLEARLVTSHRRISGTIETTLGEAIIAQGGKPAHAKAFAELFPNDEQLALGGQKGERFDIVYQVSEDERGNHLETGDLVFAAFNGKAASGSWYRFTPADTGLAEFYDARGVAANAFLTRYPVGRAPITSGFGQRTHPLTGQLHLHSGVDFRAPTGTPIYAAGAGRVKTMRFSEGYGRMMVLEHARGYETYYAHMSGYNSTLKPGDVVTRGQLIGYVGDSGSATGSHLHFEIRRNGRFVNPMTLDLPSGRDLRQQPEFMTAFLAERAEIDRLRGVTDNALTQAAPLSYRTP